MKYFTFVLTGMLALILLATFIVGGRILWQFLTSDKRVDSLRHQAHLDAEKGDLKPASKNLFKAMKIARRNNYPDVQIALWFDLAAVYARANYTDQAFLFADNAYRLALSAKDALAVAEALGYKADISVVCDLILDAITYRLQENEVLKKAKDHKMKARNLFELGLLYMRIDDNKTALKMFSKADKVNMRYLEDITFHIETMSNAAYLMVESGKFALALQTIEELLSLVKRENDPVWFDHLRYLQGCSYAQYAESKQAIKIFKDLKQNDPEGAYLPITQMCGIQAKAHISLEQEKAAEKCLIEEIERLSKFNEPPYESLDFLHSQLIEVYEMFGRPRKRERILTARVAIRDKIAKTGQVKKQQEEKDTKPKPLLN